MHITALIKQLPDTTAIKINPKTGTLIRDGVESTINPDDRQAIYGDTGQIGPQVAEFLGLPQLTYVRHVGEIDERRKVVQRTLEDAYERMESSLPALITVTSEINTPKYPRFDLLFDACEQKANINIWDAADLRVTVQIEQESGSGLGKRRVDFHIFRNKRSLVLDLKHDRGRKIFYRLASTADVIVEGFRQSVVERLGIDYPRIRKVNKNVYFSSQPVIARSTSDEAILSNRWDCHALRARNDNS